MKEPKDVINKILGKPRKNDKDFDGVKDSKDCQPNNPMKQDVDQIAERGMKGLQARMQHMHRRK